jgi:hypothetical protein
VRLLEHVGRFGSWAPRVAKMPHMKLPSWPKRPFHPRCPGHGAPPLDLVPRTLGTTQGQVFIGDGDELSDSSTPPLTPVRSGFIVQQLLCHGESLRRSQLTPRTSARSSGGGEGERRLCTPGWKIGGLKIFFLFLFSRDVLAMDDGLSISSNSVVTAKMLKPCAGISHGEADLEETHHSPLPSVPNVREFCVARTRGTTRRTQRFKRRGLYA